MTEQNQLEREIENQEIAARIRANLLKTIDGIVDGMADGLHTERKEGNEIFKLGDLVASFRNLDEKPDPGPGVELTIERGDEA